MSRFTRREVLAAAAGLAPEPRPIVSIVKVQKGRIDWAVEHAIELLGGVTAITRGKERIVLKPNLVAPVLSATTKLPVIRSLARVLKAAHKDVSIAEGSAASPNFNIRAGRTFCTSDKHLLNGMQQHVFDELGYSELARQLRVPLINLHTGDLVDVKLSGALSSTS